tara:strand:- start:1125 stop:2411 length:1287 start_codon:yes stop_codon:yes gene_type:complete
VLTIYLTYYPNMEKREIKYIATSKLTPYIRNSRTHSDEQVAQIVASITEFGFTNPILVDDKGLIIAGHGRLQAAQRMGLKEVPTIDVGYLSESQKKAYVIADNKLALNAGWDFDMLKVEFEDLMEDDFDLSLLGFEQKEINDILSVQIDGLVDKDQVPEIEDDPISKPGDVWILGEHRLMNGDSTAIDAMDKLMGDDRADLIFSDPPWNVNYGAESHPTYKSRTILNDHMKDDEWSEFVSGFCNSFYIYSKPGALIYLVMSAQEWPVVDHHLREVNFHWSSTIIWKKDTHVLSRKDYHTQYEPIWYGWNSDAPRLNPLKDRKQSDVWDFDRPMVSDLHPTTKPVELVERAINNSSGGKDIVLDLFLGSGSTLIAAEKTGRICRGMELDPKYCDVIIKRWQDFTGQVALHEESGKTYNELNEQNVGQKK